MLIYLLNGGSRPVGIGTEGMVAFDDFQRPRRTERYTAVAVYAFRLIGKHDVAVRVVAMYLVGTLPFANPAANTAAVVANHFKFRMNKINCHVLRPPLPE